jgi:hypothetical protein
MIVNHYAMPVGMKIWQYFAPFAGHFGSWSGFGLPLFCLLHYTTSKAGAAAACWGKV